MKELIYDFLCSSCFLVAKNALDSSAVLFSGIAQEKSQATTSHGWRGKGNVILVNIVTCFFFFFIPQYVCVCVCVELGVVSCSGWVFETNLQCSSCTVCTIEFHSILFAACPKKLIIQIVVVTVWTNCS